LFFEAPFQPLLCGGFGVPEGMYFVIQSEYFIGYKLGLTATQKINQEDLMLKELIAKENTSAGF
jgi:hypothetical protein